MKLIIGSDHAGFKLKEDMKKYVSKLGHEVVDLGTNSENPVDYPDFAGKVAKEVAKGGSLGILICGTGIGMCITSNKIKGIRAALCHNEFTAEMARQHNDANILCMGARVVYLDGAKRIVKKFIETKASNEKRHQLRIDKMMALE